MRSENSAGLLDALLGEEKTGQPGLQDLGALRISGHLTRNIFDRYNIIDEEDLAETGEAAVGCAESVPPTDIAVNPGLSPCCRDN